MRNPDSWQASKYILRRGKLIPTKSVQAGSRLTARRLATFYERVIPRHVRGILLDLGCGTLPFFAQYAPHVSAVLATDWHPNPHLDFTCNLEHHLPLPAQCVDTILLAEVLEHSPNPAGLWGEMYRILKPAGKVLLSVPFYYGIHEAPHDYHRFTEFALRRAAHRAGFTLVELEPLGGSPEVLTDLLAKHLSRIPLMGTPLAIGLQIFTQIFTGFGWGQKLSRHSSNAYPLGYGLVVEKGSRATSSRSFRGPQ